MNRVEIVRITSDHLLRWVDLTPQVAALLSFFKVVSQNVGPSSVGRRRPRQGDAIPERSDDFWC